MRHLIAFALCLAPVVAAPPPVSAVAYSPDGKLLAAGTRGTAFVFNAKNEPVAELTGQTQRVTALAFSATHLAVASGEPGKSGIVKLYTLAKLTDNPVTVTAHKDAIYTLAFSPDGATLATAGYDRAVHLWDVAKPDKPLRTLADHSDAVYSASWHKDGKLLATAAADRSIKVWEAATGKRLYSLTDATDWLYSVAWSADGKRLAAAGVDKSVRVWTADEKGGKLEHAAFAHSAAVLKVLWNADSTALFTAGDDKIVKKWDAAKLTETATFPARPETFLSAALAPDGKAIAVGRFDGVLELLDTTTGKPTATLLPAKPKPPAVGDVSPKSALRNTPTTLTLTGIGFDTAKEVTANGVALKLLPDGRTATSMKAEFTPSTVGPVSVVAKGEGGDSMPTRVWVDRFEVIPEPKKTDSARTADVIPLQRTVAGKLDRAGAVDYFRIELKEGEEVGVQVIAADPKGFDPVVTILDAKGTIVAEGSGATGFRATEDATYAVSVADKELRGGSASEYRLHVGRVPVVTRLSCLGVRRGEATEVFVSGVFLNDADTRQTMTVPADAMVGSRVPIPMPMQAGEMPLGLPTLVVSEFPRATVLRGKGVVIDVPGTHDDVLLKHSAEVWFTAKKGQRLVVEVEAARLGSPLDSHIEIVDAKGQPVPRSVLRSVARTLTTFRDHDSANPGIRLDTWNELKMNDYLYGRGELLRIKDLPRNPDDDCQFVQVGGKRTGALGTTPVHHAQNAPLYKVELHPPGSTFPDNGMPTFDLPYRNDDGGAGFGKDSVLHFDPPADGEYKVRLTDTRGNSGPSYAYRLTVRLPRPDFTLSVSPQNPSVWKNGGVPITVTATRSDGFTGPIAISFDGLTAPFTLPATTIEAEQTTAVVTLFADGDTTKAPAAYKAVGLAKIDGKDVKHEATGGTPTLRDPGDLVTTTNAAEVAIQPGQEAKLTVKVARQGDFKGRVPIEVRGLPHGVRVLNIGLNGILVMPDQTEREIVLYAEPWVTAMNVPVVVSARSERKGSEHAAKSVAVVVR